MMSYITYAQLAKDVQVLARKLPRSLIGDLAGVLGVPRSGMLPATMLANHFHLPLSDTYSFCTTGWLPRGGSRLAGFSSIGNTLLVVDDSIHTGTSMSASLAVCRDSFSQYTFVSATIYRCPEKQAPVDYYALDVAKPRYFEWNLMQHPDMNSFMLDLDGVLCYDPTVFDDDGPEYVKSISEAQPFHTPRFPIHSICTMRLEHRREVTEKWLADYGIKYERLIMVGLDTANKRRRILDYELWKGEHYKRSDARLFIESSAMQGEGIAQVSGKPVICLEDNRLYTGEDLE